MDINNLQHKELHIPHFSASPGQAWCLFGENGSGIERLIDLFAGRLEGHVADHLDLPKNPGILSFLDQQRLFEEELRNDDSDFLDRPDPGTLVREFLPNHREHRDLLLALGMEGCLDKGYRQLSSGQARKLLLLGLVLGGHTTLLLENPYDGLDIASCRQLDDLLQLLPQRGVTVLVTIADLSQLPSWAENLAVVANGILQDSGPITEVLPRWQARAAERARCRSLGEARFRQRHAAREEELIALNGGFAAYGDQLLFSGLHLHVASGDHTLITGPNGCGKSTLLDIICGDNPKCYANDLHLFGKKRGQGESIWQIKREMGLVSPALHREHRVPGSALHIVLSGLYDTIGLYRRPASAELREARQWLQWLDLASQAETPFRRLSYAEQRRVLIGRAMIKGPRLLLLDEPTHGLDEANRQAFLDLLQRIADENLSTIVYVSHRQDEYRQFFRQHIRLETYAA